MYRRWHDAQHLVLYAYLREGDYKVLSRLDNKAVFNWRGVRGFDPPQEVADPQKVLQNLFGGSTLTPLRTPDSIFLLNQYIYVQL